MKKYLISDRYLVFNGKAKVFNAITPFAFAKVNITHEWEGNSKFKLGLTKLFKIRKEEQPKANNQKVKLETAINKNFFFVKVY